MAIGTTQQATGFALRALSALSPTAAGAAAWALFCTPVARTKERPQERAILARAGTDTLEIGGKAVRVYSWGTAGPLVLLLHGWGSRASRLAAFVDPLLGHGCSVVAFDFPGHGASSGRSTTILEVRRIVGALEQRHGPYAGVLGYSFGSLCAAHALRDGVRAERLVALAGVSRFDHLVTGFTAQLGLGPAVRADLRHRVETRLFPDIDDPWHTFDATADPKRLSADRVLLLHDRDDDMAWVGQAEETAAALGERAELVVTTGLGHSRIRFDPAVVARAVDFLAGVTAGRSETR